LHSWDAATQDVLSIVGESRNAICPSELYEGFPMVIVEAYACGTPVIARALKSDEIVVMGNGRSLNQGTSDLAEKINDLVHTGSKLTP